MLGKCDLTLKWIFERQYGKEPEHSLTAFNVTMTKEDGNSLPHKQST